jgi:hypothetical protein
MQRGIGALGETAAHFDIVEANTVRFDNEIATHNIKFPTFTLNAADNKNTRLAQLAPGEGGFFLTQGSGSLYIGFVYKESASVHHWTSNLNPGANGASGNLQSN